MILVKSPKKLSLKYVQKINPKMIFFPDWSWIVPAEIVNNYKCICFHESDLPKFRGGSPIQNQIIRRIENTKSTAFLMTDGLDEGEIILKRNLSLKGSLEEIFERMIENNYSMIQQIIQGKYVLTKQKGKPTKFRRRTPKESELNHLDFPKKYLYNFIRMLSDPYPNAFIKIGKRQIIFKNASFDGKVIKFSGELK